MLGDVSEGGWVIGGDGRRDVVCRVGLSRVGFQLSQRGFELTWVGEANGGMWSKSTYYSGMRDSSLAKIDRKKKREKESS